jgi:hypothetical protein
LDTAFGAHPQGTTGAAVSGPRPKSPGARRAI